MKIISKNHISIFSESITICALPLSNKEIQRLRFRSPFDPHNMLHSKPLYNHSIFFFLLPCITPHFPLILLLILHHLLRPFSVFVLLLAFSSLSPTMAAEKERDTQVYLAKLAEQAERYEGLRTLFF